MKKKLFAISSATLLALTLTACGGSDSAKSSDQTVEEACSTASTELQSFSDKYSDLSTELASDPAAALEALETMKADIDSVGASITNTEVKTAWDTFTGGFNELVTAAKDEDMTKASDATTKLMEGATALGEVCPSDLGSSSN